MPEVVTAIRRVPFSGRVYNLSVREDRTYVLNGIITHNCMCYLLLERMTREEVQERLERWRQGEPWPEMEQYLLTLGLGQPVGLPAAPLPGEVGQPALPPPPEDRSWLWWLLLLLLAEGYRRWREADERETDESLQWNEEEQ